MTGKELSKVISTIENEGFDYTFMSYSHFGEIKDEKFHELREKYINAYKKLAEYLKY